MPIIFLGNSNAVEIRPTTKRASIEKVMLFLTFISLCAVSTEKYLKTKLTNQLGGLLMTAFLNFAELIAIFLLFNE